MEKQKANKFPLVKLFTVDGASCYLYDGRANMFLSLSETEKNLVCEYMASYGTSEGEPCPASFSSDAAAFIARLNGNGILLPGPLEARTPSRMRGEEELWQQWEEEAIPKKTDTGNDQYLQSALQVLPLYNQRATQTRKNARLPSLERGGCAESHFGLFP